ITPSHYAVEVYGIIVKDFDTMQYISGALKTFNRQTEQMENTAINCTMDWNVSGISADSYKDRLKELQKETGYEVDIYSEYVSSFYEMNGGFLFLGIVIGLIFLTGTILITYYKQINEGYEDREKYQIMKKVGLSDELIKKTSSSQIGWMFYAPLIIAIIHCIVASKIVYQLLGLFAVKSFVQYGTFAFSVIAVFFGVYFIIFKLTSRAYYRMVK
ncbi:MAG: ABC transporter permease, partial [Anaerovoracaceae bacterium]